MKRLLRYLLSFLIVVLIVIGIRIYCVGSYRLSTDSMKRTLQKGDFVLVNKIAGNHNPGRNRIVLFKSPLQKDLKSPPLFLSRCIGMPGDTIRISREGYLLNGKLLPNSPSVENSYRIRKNIKEPLLATLRKLQIPYRDITEDSLNLMIRLTPREEVKLRENLPDILQIQLIPEEDWSYTFIIPAKGYPYPMDSASLLLYKEAILTETEGNAMIRDGKLFQNGKELDKFFFQQNYYWMLSDNEEEAIDSRHLGLIPERAIIGNVWFCWYSKNRERVFKHIN